VAWQGFGQFVTPHLFAVVSVQLNRIYASCAILLWQQRRKELTFLWSTHKINPPPATAACKATATLLLLL
jgi:hypothetical protein